ncbi:MAG: cytidylate kinase [Chloroflexi bacterium]|nr:cytidylate kinase [Chloroflexota bacterium]
MINNLKSIAIDGPAASGKSAVGKKLSELLNYDFLDTGIMYRAVTYISISELLDPVLVSAYFGKSLLKVKLKGEKNKIYYKNKDITSFLFSDYVDKNVSDISKITRVRKNLVKEQINISKINNIVMVGRDIGTIVLPNSNLKIYLDASIDIRAKRRSKELGLNSFDVEKKIKLRDVVDSNRKNSPLAIDKDAHLINTDLLNVDEVVIKIKELLEDD